MPFRSLIVLLAVTLGACSASSSQPDIEALGTISEHDAIVAAAATSSVAGHAISVDGASVWYDGMPGSNDPGLIVSARLKVADGAFPTDVFLDHFYVVRGNDVWVTNAGEQTVTSNEREGTGRNGPEGWSEGDLTDIVIRVDGPDGASTYVAVRGVAIEVPE